MGAPVDGVGSGEIAPTPDPAAGRHPRSVRRTVLAFVGAAIALVAVPLVVSRLVDGPEREDRVFEIPAGTADRLAAGEDVQILPADLRLGLEDRLVVINSDDRTHQVGPFTIQPGERLARRFSEAATLSGYCSLHTSDRIEIQVGRT